MKKTAFLILAVLCLAVSISAQTVIPDVDSVTIKTDTDVSGVGKFEVQTQNVPRVTVANDGKVGVGVTSPQATIHLGGTQELGFEQTMRLETNEAGTAPFGWTLAKYAGSNGATTQDNVFCWGYNVGPAGNKIVASQPAYGHCLENDYTTAEGARQMEQYDFFLPGDDCIGAGCTAQRPFSITPNRTNGQIINRLVGLHVTDLNNVQQTTFDSDINFWNAGGAIKFNGARSSNDLIYAGGSTMLSFKFNTANKVDLFPTGIGNAEVGIMNAAPPEAVLTLNFGGTYGALNPNGVGIRKNGGMQFNSGNGWQNMVGSGDVSESNAANKIVKRDSSGTIDTTAVKINGTEVLTGQCAAIIDPQPGERINNVTTIAILNCLRSIKILAE